MPYNAEPGHGRARKSVSPFLALQGGVLNIIMEYANGGDMAATIQRRQQEKKPFSEDEIMFW